MAIDKQELHHLVDQIEDEVELGFAYEILKNISNFKQEWYWTDEWQKGEKEADNDIQEGRTKSFDSVDDFLDDLFENLDVEE